MENKLKEPKPIYQQKLNSLATNGRLFFLIGFIIACFATVVAFEWKVYTSPQALDITQHKDEKAIQLLPAPVVPIPKLTPTTPQVKEVDSLQVFESEEDKGQPLQPKTLLAKPVVIEAPDVEIEIGCDCCLAGDEIQDILPPPPSSSGTNCGIWMVEQLPQPLGGYQRFHQFLSKHIKYPAQARRMGVEGKVLVEFVVERNGQLTQFKILRDIGGDCGQEAIRVLKKAPKWSPGKQRGKAVKTKFTVPINFNLH